MEGWRRDLREGVEVEGGVEGVERGRRKLGRGRAIGGMGWVRKAGEVVQKGS